MDDPSFLLVWTNFPAAREDAFNAWYDNEHLPDRLAIPGMREVRRYRALSGGPKYAALYEAGSAEVMLSPAYMALRARPDPNSKNFIPFFTEVIRANASASVDRGGGVGRFAVLQALDIEGEAAGVLAWLGNEVLASLDAVRTRLLVTDRALMAAQASGLAGSERKGMRAPEQVASCVVVLEAESAAACAEMGLSLSRALERREDVRATGVGVFEMITRLVAE